MKCVNKLIICFEILILIFFGSIVYKDWNVNPVTKDYFSILIIGEIGLDLYFRIKTKTNK
jgi:hypothetical protein